MMNRIFVFTIILFCLSSCSSSQKVTTEQAVAEGYAPKGSIRDMVLIYDGGTHRREVWNEELFQPYVYAPRQNAKGGDWLFDGFLFLEIFDGNRCGFASGYRPTPATKEDWIMLIDKYFTPGRSICALNDCIENAKSVCGKLPKKRKIVLSLPEPIPNQKNWGELDGKKLDFSKDEDRISACKWYIDFITERFKKAHLKNVELAGFYWLAEEATHTRTFVKHIADYIHEDKQSFYWIPYFKSDGYTTWKELGFDKAYLQPNHFFNSNIPDSRIDDACKLARQYGMSMECEFDERALNDKAPRMHAYIDGFERNHVFENTDVAYYQGGSAFYALKNGSEKDVVLYYRLANIIIKRQKARR